MSSQFIKAFTNLFKKPQTTTYPQDAIERTENYRGLIEYTENECIYCLKCEKACPPGAILFVPCEDPVPNDKNKKSLKYEYNPWLCIYCTECIRACPKAELALTQSDKKPQIGVKGDRVNSEWTILEQLKKGV
ncbi:MAG: 4Fe-4S dicluster domain-containing protein [Helicobacteraceae bacterium]|nr:4Fe-4S dicluster domain-containing protein [Helicobacteraceae bacterium]